MNWDLGPRGRISLLDRSCLCFLHGLLCIVLFFNFRYFVNTCWGAYILIAAFSFIALIVGLVCVKHTLCAGPCAGPWGGKRRRTQTPPLTKFPEMERQTNVSALSCVAVGGVIEV